MKQTTETSSMQGILPEIQAIDLKRIKWKLMDAEEGPGWSQELADHAEQEYKRFLTMNKLFPQLDIVPNKLMDKFWHQHILDTKAYARDCKKMFGYFLHHYPYFGMHGKEDQQNLHRAFDDTKVLYQALFDCDMDEHEISRCQGHPCHAPSRCACRAPGTCKK